MNVDEALRQLIESEDLPREALQWSLDHWNEASGRYLSKLRLAASRGKPDDADGDALFFIVHLFGEMRDVRGYAPLCNLIAANSAIGDWLGDGITVSLPGLLINMFDGDSEPLHRAIESVAADEFARGSALGALSYLVKFGQTPGEPELRDYLQQLLRESGPREPSYFWSAWADTVSRMGYASFAADVARLCSKGWIERDLMTIENFHADLAASRSEPAATELFTRLSIEPFGSTIAALESWDQPHSPIDLANGEQLTDYSGRIGTPFVDPNRDIGRNDPCPCGSGKKYKKCCLAA